MKYGTEIPLLNQLDFIQVTGQEPTWFTNDMTLLILFLLSLAEIAGDKIPEVKQGMNQVFVHAKPVIASLSTLGVLNASDAAFVSETMQAGLFDIINALIVGGGVFMSSQARESMMSVLVEADEDDELGIQGVISWLDDFWATFGTFILFVFPFLIALTSIAIILFFRRMAKRAQRREEQSKISCSSCETKMFKSALECPSCNTENSSPHSINWMGNSTEEVCISREQQKAELMLSRRCPVCASRLEKRSTKQICPECNHATFENGEDAQLFLDKMSGRLPGVLVVSFLFGLIPVVGLIVGIILFRIKLVAPFRRYIPLHKSFFIKWGIRIFFLILMLLQLVPVLGAFAMPVLAIVSYNSYKRSFCKSLRKM